jgi:hypothetical protein
MDKATFTRDADQVWVDDTGLIDGLKRFSIATYGHPLAGKAVVIGCDPRTGEARDPQVSVDDLRMMVRF